MEPLMHGKSWRGNELPSRRKPEGEVEASARRPLLSVPEPARSRRSDRASLTRLRVLLAAGASPADALRPEGRAGKASSKWKPGGSNPRILSGDSGRPRTDVEHGGATRSPGLPPEGIVPIAPAAPSIGDLIARRSRPGAAPWSSATATTWTNLRAVNAKLAAALLAQRGTLRTPIEPCSPETTTHTAVNPHRQEDTR